MRGIDIPDEVKRRLLRSANEWDSDSRGIGEWRKGAVQQSRNLDVLIKWIKNSWIHQTKRQIENMNDSVECCGESWSGSGDHGDTPDQRLRSRWPMGGCYIASWPGPPPAVAAANWPENIRFQELKAETQEILTWYLQTQQCPNSSLLSSCH